MSTATAPPPKPPLQGESQPALDVSMVPIADVIPTPDNPRKITDTAAMRTLTESVRANGIIQPPVGRPHPTKKGKIDLRCGARRLEAARRVGMTEIPIILRTLDDVEAKPKSAAK